MSEKIIIFILHTNFYLIFIFIKQLDAWVEPSAVGRKVDLHVPRAKLTSCKKMLEKNGIEFTSMVNDLEDLLNQEKQSNQKNAFASYFDYDKYNQWSEVKKKQSIVS